MDDPSNNNTKNVEKKKDLIKLDVGGYHYCTTRATLTTDPHSMLAIMFSEERFSLMNNLTDEGRVFIDRDGEHFGLILNYLRDNEIDLPDPMIAKKLLRESRFYGLEGLTSLLEHGNDEIESMRESFESQLNEMAEEKRILEESCTNKQKEIDNFARKEETKRKLVESEMEQLKEMLEEEVNRKELLKKQLFATQDRVLELEDMTKELQEKLQVHDSKMEEMTEAELENVKEENVGLKKKIEELEYTVETLKGRVQLQSETIEALKEYNNILKESASKTTGNIQ